mgnify:CR=1 FL=1
MSEQIQDEKLQPGLHIDQEVDLLEYLHAILRVKYRILVLSILIAGAVFGASKLVENKYKATVLVAVNISEGFGGTKPGQYRGSDVVGLLEYSFMVDEPADNELDRVMARLGSSTFIELFIAENNLLKYIYREHWDDQNQSWKESFEPSVAAASNVFRKTMLNASVDSLTGLVPISITTNNGAFSADLANAYYKRFNQYVREKRLAELAAQRDLLNKRLELTTNIEMQRSINRMLETQLAEEIIRSAKDDYPLEVIQTAQTPLFKSSPNRKLWTILAFILSVVFGVVICVGRVIMKKITNALAVYNPKSKENISGDVKSDKSILNKKKKVFKDKDKDKVAVLDDLNEWLD